MDGKAGDAQSARQQTLIGAGAARDQAVLPTTVAFRICMRGIRTRLGRSLVTLSGVALGIAFLMAVLAGFHVKKALAADMERLRTIDRMVSMLRAEIGILKGKRIFAIVGSGGAVEEGVLSALVRKGAAVSIAGQDIRVDGVEYLNPGLAVSRADAVVLLGDYGRLMTLLDRVDLAARIIMFEDRDDALGRLAREGRSAKHLSIALREEELERIARREREERYRMYWILGVSLLITVGGISNAMLMSVTERFREIGTMKCLGALSSFVVKMFLIESSLMGLVGSAVGGLLGLLFAIAAYGNVYGFLRTVAAANLLVLVGYFVVCLIAGVALSVIAGIYPARVAARMIPAVALATNV